MPPAKTAPKRAAPKQRIAAATTKEQRQLRILYVGNFGVRHSTENHIRRALQANGHTVMGVQENDPRMWFSLDDLATDPMGGADLVLWTRTGWDYERYGYSSQLEAIDAQSAFLRRMEDAGIPVIGYHLDLWHGLRRVDEVYTEPFFRSTLVITADGDPAHEADFAAHGINHHWFPPAVSEPECEPGMFRDEFHSKLAFVGSHNGTYHRESEHRFQLVDFLKTNFRSTCKFYPEDGQPAVRNEALRDLYASAEVIVGDSCLAGQISNYWSDRIPETLGRGGFLLHPSIPGLAEQFPMPGLPWRWMPFDFAQLDSIIEDALSMTAIARRELTNEARAYVLAHHTYEVRMRQMVDLLEERGILS